MRKVGAMSMVLLLLLGIMEMMTTRVVMHATKDTTRSMIGMVVRMVVRMPMIGLVAVIKPSTISMVTMTMETEKKSLRVRQRSRSVTKGTLRLAW